MTLARRIEYTINIYKQVCITIDGNTVQFLYQDETDLLTALNGWACEIEQIFPPTKYWDSLEHYEFSKLH